MVLFNEPGYANSERITGPDDCVMVFGSMQINHPRTWLLRCNFFNRYTPQLVYVTSVVCKEFVTTELLGLLRAIYEALHTKYNRSRLTKFSFFISSADSFLLDLQRDKADGFI